MSGDMINKTIAANEQNLIKKYPLGAFFVLVVGIISGPRGIGNLFAGWYQWRVSLPISDLHL